MMGKIIAVLALIMIAAGGFFVWQKYQAKPVSQEITWEECIKIPGAVMQTSYPGVCVTPDGRRATQPLSPEEKKKLQPPYSNSGISGKVSIWPTSPVCYKDFSCSRPYAGTVLVMDASGTSEITRFTSDSAGNFKISLAPGTYVLTSLKAKFPTLQPKTVSVSENSYTQVALQFDSGIR